MIWSLNPASTIEVIFKPSTWTGLIFVGEIWIDTNWIDTLLLPSSMCEDQQKTPFYIDESRETSKFGGKVRKMGVNWYSYYT